MFASDKDGREGISTPHIQGLNDWKLYTGYTSNKRCVYEVKLEHLDGCCVFHFWSVRGMTVCNAAETVIDQILEVHCREKWFPKDPGKLAWIDHGETTSIMDIKTYMYLSVDYANVNSFALGTASMEYNPRLSAKTDINWINAPFPVEELLTHPYEVYRKIAKSHLVEHAIQ